MEESNIYGEYNFGSEKVIRAVKVYHPNHGTCLLTLGTDTEIRLRNIGDTVSIRDGDNDMDTVFDFPRECIIICQYDEKGDGTPSKYTEGDKLIF